MKDLASCFRQHAINIASASASAAASAAGDSSATDPSVQTLTSSVFKARLSSGKPVIIKLSWSWNQLDPSLSIGVDDNPDFRNPWKTATKKSQLLRKKKGDHSFHASSSSINLHWDFSAARYGPGPEPIAEFYVAVIIDGEIALLAGDQNGEFLKGVNEKLPVAEFSMLCKREQVVGRSLQSTTRARFGDAGKDHEITLRCREGELLVSIDKKRVVRVVKLNWNFRGNQTVFVDGWPVDVMWDMHGWWRSSLAGHAVFLFRQRSKLESRLWLEEKETLGFSLLIQAFRNSS